MTWSVERTSAFLDAIKEHKQKQYFSEPSITEEKPTISVRFSGHFFHNNFNSSIPRLDAVLVLVK